MALSPLVLQASSLSAAISDLEETKKTMTEEKKQLETTMNSLMTEIDAIKSRMKKLDKSIADGEHEQMAIKERIKQGKEAKAKIEDGMHALLETLEREERIFKQANS